MQPRQFAILVVGVCAFSEARSAWAGPATDGKWTVIVVTEAGRCEKVYRFPVIIENGQPRYGGSESVTVSGQVAANGSVNGVISQWGGSAQVRGRLSGRLGKGTWTTSALSGCSGYWRATKAG